VSEVAVRAAGTEDLDRLVAANLALASETEGRELEETTVRRGVLRVLQDPVRGRYWIAEVDGRPVGSLLVTREWSDWRDGWFWWIQSVWVEPESRRKGVYAALHDNVRRRAAEAPDVAGLRLYVDRDNRVAESAYLKFGMVGSRYLLFEQTIARS